MLSDATLLNYTNEQQRKASGSFTNELTCQNLSFTPTPTDFSSVDETLQDAPVPRKKIRSVRPNSTYIPQNRLSRYRFASLLPFRLTNTSKTEIPVDSIGLLSNTSFSWTRKFFVSKSERENLDRTSTFTAPDPEPAFLLPKATYSDSCDVNGKRLLGIYKDQEQTHGQKRASLFRTCNKFSRTRILISTFIHILSIFLALFGVSFFITLTLHEKDVKKAIGYLLGAILCHWLSHFFKSMINWLNLRTASRLRTAVLASVYKKAMKSCISHNVAPHQILTLANEESEVLFRFIENGMKITGTVVGVLLSLVASAILMGNAGTWPFFGIIGLFVLGIVMAKVSGYRFRQSLLYAAQKLTIVEDLCLNFKTLIIHQFDQIYFRKFTDMMAQEYSALVHSKLFASNLSGGIASSILIGGLYLVWCDIDFPTDSPDDETTTNKNMLVLVIIYAFFLKHYVYDFTESIQSIFNGKACLDKIKSAYSIHSPELSKMRPNSNLAVEINAGVFEWPPSVDSAGVKKKSKKRISIMKENKFTLNIEQLYVVKNQIVGIVGAPKSGKTSLLYSIMGHTKLARGTIRIKGKMAFLPDQPYITTETLRENVLMHQPFEGVKYYNSISAMKLNEDVCVTAGADDLTLGELNLDENQLERVALARALYSQRDVFLLDDPFKRLEDDSQALILFKNLINMLSQSNATVVVATNRPEFLEMCQKIYYLENGEIRREGSLGEIGSQIQDLLIQSYNIRVAAGFDKKIEGCQKDGRTITKLTKIKSSSRRNIRHSNADGFSILNSEEDLSDNNGDELNSSLLSWCSIALLTIVYLVINAVYYFAPVGMIFRMVPPNGNVDGKNDGLSAIGLGAIVVIFVLDIFSKIYLANIGASLSKRYLKLLFQKLIRSTLNSHQYFSISDIVNLFAIDLSPAFKAYGTCIDAITCIVLTITLIALMNPYSSIVVAVVLIAAILLYFYVRSSLAHWHSFEYRSNAKLSVLLTNTLRGRAVIQSYDQITEFAKECYEAIEENTTAMFLQKSIVFHVEFLLNAILALGFAGVGVIQLTVAFYSDKNFITYNFVVAIFAYYCFAHDLNRLLTEGLLMTISARKQMAHLRQNLGKIPKIMDVQSQEMFDDKYGVPIKFREIVCQISKKDLLVVNKIFVQSGETVGIRGRGSSLISSLLFRVFEPTSGEIFIGSRDLGTIDRKAIFSLIGIVSDDPNINDATISSFLTTQELNDIGVLQTLIKELKIWENITNYPMAMDEPLINVSRSDKQLFSLAKCILLKPQIIIIEYPHPDAQFIIDTTVQTYFSEMTTIIVGSSDNQFTKCDRVINLDTKY